ncbi:MAG TPA: transposase [Acidimicrobiales bacterium]|nr:transposase [Acidimicrobiales bacterium]
MTSDTHHGVASLEAPLTEEDLAALNELLRSAVTPTGETRSQATTAVLARISERLPSEASAYELLERLRWRGLPECPHCGVVGAHAYLRPANGLSRTTNRGRQSERRVWKCRACKRQFSVITGTVMHGTHVPIRTWILVAFEIASTNRELSDREVERRYGLSSKSAHFLLQRVRDDLSRPAEDSLFAHVVATDEHRAPVGTRPEATVTAAPNGNGSGPVPGRMPDGPRGIIAMW